MIHRLRGVALAAAVVSAAGVSDARGQDEYRALGAADAPLEMVIYSDFECPFCRNFALAALPAIRAEFVDSGQLRIRYAYLPLAAVHTNAVATAKAAHCAGTAGRFWAYHDYLFVRQPEWAGEEMPDSLWIAYAENVGLAPDDFQTCFVDPDTHAFVEADLRRALQRGATGTPTIVLAGESIAGITSYEELRHRIREALADTTRPQEDLEGHRPP